MGMTLEGWIAGRASDHRVNYDYESGHVERSGFVRGLREQTERETPVFPRQVAATPDDRVIASRASCRTQLGYQPESEESPHPVKRRVAAFPVR